MIEETVSNTGEVPKELSADAGYYSARAVEELSALGVDPFIAPERTRHGARLEPAPRGRIPKGLSPRDRMRRTKHGRKRYALRMETVEPVFGQIKHGRGFRQFLLRGLEKVNPEWQMICTGHNLLKLFRYGAGRGGNGQGTGRTPTQQNPNPEVSSACSRQVPLEFFNIHKPTLSPDGFLRLNPAVQLPAPVILGRAARIGRWLPLDLTPFVDPSKVSLVCLGVKRVSSMYAHPRRRTP